MGSQINIDRNNINLANSILSIITIYKDIEIETVYIKKILKEKAAIFARLINQNRFKHHIFFSASFYKINEEDQRRDKIELFFKLNINQTLRESDIKNINVKP